MHDIIYAPEATIDATSIGIATQRRDRNAHRGPIL